MSEHDHSSSTADERAKIARTGLVLGQRNVPLYAGSVHYFRLEPSTWRPALEALKSLGLHVVDTYVPWGVHEGAAGVFDFGEYDARLDVAAFLRLVGELGMTAMVRPGPHINAELTWFGIPERVIWDDRCQARSPRGKPVVLTLPPLPFPVPSYASRAFHEEARRWLSAVAGVLGPLAWPAGPIVLCQIDNEAAFYFRDAVYDQDYHPDAVAQYRRFVEERYGTVAALRTVYGDPTLDFSTLTPPARFDGSVALDLARHLDWAEAQEKILADALAEFRQALGPPLSELVSTHNLPPGDSASVLDPEKLERAVEVIGIDCYHPATPADRAAIARRTSELDVRAEARGYPTFAGELGAGFAPYYPPLSEVDNQFCALSSVAYGLRAFNVYMAVERDRWVGAPISRRGELRPSAQFWRRLTAALERTRFPELRRRADVAIVVPRSYRRLARVLHAFGPLNATVLHMLNRSFEQSTYEDDFGLGEAVIPSVQAFLDEVERTLDRLRIPYCFAPGDLVEAAIERSSYTIVACPGGLESHVALHAGRAIAAGRAVSFGPHAPDRDDRMRPRTEPLSLLSPPGAKVPALLRLPDTAQELERAIRALGLSGLDVSPSELHVTVHDDAEGKAAVLFALNPEPRSVRARIGCFGASRVEDALDATTLTPHAGFIELEVPARTVRMLELY